MRGQVPVGRQGTASAHLHPASAGPALSGLGATRAQWESRHGAPTGGTGGPSYGPQIPFAQGKVEQFTAVKVEKGRIVGWHMAFRDGTAIGSSEQQVYAQLPSDARQTASRRATFTGSTDTCEIVTFESATLTTVLGADHATVGVTLFQVGVTGQGSPSIQVVDRAIVTVPAPPPTTAPCCDGVPTAAVLP